MNDSVISLGCGARMNEILSGKKISVACLGASITCGYHATADGTGKAFPEFLKELLEKKTGSEVEMNNLAVSGTNSLTGMLVTQIFLPRLKPDIVVLEYSINEESHPIGLEKFESLLRMLLSMEWKPVVLPVAVFNRDGYSCQEYMLHFSKHYGLPMAGLYQSVYPLITSGVLPMDVYTEDEGHPHVDGHEFIAKCIMKTIERSAAENAAFLPLPPKVTDALCCQGSLRLPEFAFIISQPGEIVQRHIIKLRQLNVCAYRHFPKSSFILTVLLLFHSQNLGYLCLVHVLVFTQVFHSFVNLHKKYASFAIEP